MFHPEHSQEQFHKRESKHESLKTQESGILERIPQRGREWLKIIALSALSTAFVEGAFSSQARADDVAIQKTIHLLAERSNQPAPFDSLEIANQFTNIDEGIPNTPEAKIAALTSRPKLLSTPGVGIHQEIAPGVDVRASLDNKTEGGYALVTFNADFL